MRSSLRVFEHQLVKVGHALISDGPAQTFQQSHVDALARYNDQHGGDCFRLGYRSITTTQYVGYVEVGDLCIEILPKADRGTHHGDETRWRDALLEMLRVATGLDLWTPTLASQHTTRTTLMELVAARFVLEVEALLHAGLARSYRDEESNGSVLRGKLMFTQHIRDNAARADRFCVRHTSFDRDIPVNRILKQAMDVLVDRPLSGSLPGRTRGAIEALGELSPITINPSTFDRLQLGRSTLRYRNALILARVILEQLSPSLRAGHAPVFALLFDMNTLWERYVAATLRSIAGPAWQVSAQESLSFWRAPDLSMRRVRPDIVIRDRATNAVHLVADTKWKLAPDGIPSDDDLKQMFVYNELLGSGRAVLIYPWSGAASGRAAAFEGRSHICESLHIPVPERGKRQTAELARLLAPSRTAAAASQW